MYGILKNNNCSVWQTISSFRLLATRLTFIHDNLTIKALRIVQQIFWMGSDKPNMKTHLTQHLHSL